jgi:putative endonuclease
MYVYVIRSEKDGRFYVGLTSNVKKRVSQHNTGRTRSTKAYRPWKLFFFEECLNRIEARKRERYLKSGYGKQWIKKSLKGPIAQLVRALDS